MSDEAQEPQEAEVPAEAEDTPTQEEPEFREISDEELHRILEEHRRWVESEELEEKAGIQADLSNVNLQGKNLQGKNLQKAILTGTNLREANMQDADLQEAFLVGANLQEANLRGVSLFGADLRRAKLREADLHGAKLQWANLLRTELRETNLQDADLTGATGLLGEQLTDANVSGATLPEPILEFEGLKTVEEASRNARKIFQVMLLACAYSLLTIFSTKDAALLTNSSSSPLPIIQTGVPIAGFFVVAPIILFAAYLYFHIYLQRLWEGLAKLPAVFPDGRPLDQRAYPWLLNGLVRSHFTLLKGARPPLSRPQTRVSIFLAWWAVPGTLLLLWGRYIPRHGLWGTVTHVTLLSASIGFGLLSFRLACAALRGEEWEPINWRADVGKAFKRSSEALVSFVFFLALSLGAIYGVSHRETLTLIPIGEAYTIQGEVSYQEAVSYAFGFFGWRTHANLAEEDVSTKPPSWTGLEDKAKEEIALVKGARLRDLNLRYANAVRAFLVKADLRQADLRGADLREAKLQMADLTGAKLQKANLSVANLHGAKLQDADLTGADLHGAELFQADLQGANLQEVNLRGAEHLDASQVRAAKKKWHLAYYGDKFLKKYGKELGLPESEEKHTKNVNRELAKLKNWKLN